MRGRSPFRGEWGHIPSVKKEDLKKIHAGSFEHTPQHLYDVDDPCFGFVESSWSCSRGGDWGDYDHNSS
jgi:hypothetical protein